MLPGQGLAGKVAAGFKRKISGGSVVMTEYAGPDTVGFAGDAPGTIRAVELEAGESIIVQRGGFLAASPSMVLSVGLVKRLRVRLAGHGVRPRGRRFRGVNARAGRRVARGRAQSRLVR